MKYNIKKNNPNWKGNIKLSYDGIHRYVRLNKPKPKLCEECNKDKELELAYKDHSIGRKQKIKYNRNLNKWKWMCRSCHVKLDGRIKNLTKGLPLCKKCGVQTFYHVIKKVMMHRFGKNDFGIECREKRGGCTKPQPLLPKKMNIFQVPKKEALP